MIPATDRAPAVRPTSAGRSGRDGHAAVAITGALRHAHSMEEIAAATGRSRRAVRALCARLSGRGVVERVGFALYRLPGDPWTPPSGSEARPQPIRDAILAFLDRPRHAKQIAERIGRSVPNATGHLRAMLRKKLVRRVETGVYVRTNAPAAPGPAGAKPAVRARRTARQADLVALLAQPRTAGEIAARFEGRPWFAVVRSLRIAREAGLVAALPDGRYAAVGGAVKREVPVLDARRNSLSWRRGAPRRGVRAASA